MPYSSASWSTTALAKSRPTLMWSKSKREVVLSANAILKGNLKITPAGLLHMHLLVTLVDRIDSAAKVDSIISAEIPDPVCSKKF